MVAPLITGPNRIPRADAGRTGAQDETINNLVLANRILASRELGILGTTGHVSVHGEIFKARPDVMAVLHAHTPELVAFTESSVALRPMVNGGVFIGDGLRCTTFANLIRGKTSLELPSWGKLWQRCSAKSPQYC